LKNKFIMKKAITILFAVLYSVLLFSQEKKIKWYSIEEAEKLIKDNPRPLFIDTYTDWCGWCKKLDQETFSNPVVAEILSTRYYPVKFDAEGKQNVFFLGKTYINDGKAGKAHQLAVALLQGQLSYPTVVFLNEKGQLLTPVPGFRNAKEMEKLLSFFAEKAYEKQNFDDFQKSFKGRIQ
ncbi:MAG: thioredoxin, partial [Odoribacter sp.]|nr:thioredoxin [Odoribacter sp.]